ncbi:hypothetical protein [Arthrobacter sp. NPDC057013]|uniref:hypothetical protein n=1 Tax=Arthrobacter sp. NPDC057013 TaxID=3345999 RepID=UPI00363CD20C
MIPDDEQKARNGSSWKLAAGEYVEVTAPGIGTRRGTIEAVMRDKSGFWLAADGVEPRVFVPLEEKELRIRSAPSQGKCPPTRSAV